MLRSLLSILVVSFGILFPAHAAVPHSELPVMYFDLGNVLIDTRNDTQLRYVAGAEAYLRSLAQRGFRMAIITNIPETWGRTQEEKVVALKAYVAKGWVEPQPFPWQIFERILIPPSDKLRKPHPYMFQLAMIYANQCQPWYQGEDLPEITAARKERMAAYLVPENPTPTSPKFFPIQRIRCQQRQDRFATRRPNGN